MASFETVQRKWDTRYQQEDVSSEPSKNLLENAHLLPAKGMALDLACGLGGNALFLAKQGLEVSAWDISSVAIKTLDNAAQKMGVTLNLEVCDVEQRRWEQSQFDVIVVNHFLERSLRKNISSALKIGGLLYYQTFVNDKVADVGPRNPDFLLEQNELLRLFASLKVVVYREEGCIGDIGKGFRNEALLVAQRINLD